MNNIAIIDKDIKNIYGSININSRDINIAIIVLATIWSSGNKIPLAIILDSSNIFLHIVAVLLLKKNE